MGAGGALIGEFLHILSDKNVGTVYLEVRESNAEAISLYKNMVLNRTECAEIIIDILLKTLY